MWESQRTIDHDACLTPNKGEKKYKRLSTNTPACNSFLRRKGLARQGGSFEQDLVVRNRSGVCILCVLAGACFG